MREEETTRGRIFRKAVIKIEKCLNGTFQNNGQTKWEKGRRMGGNPMNYGRRREEEEDLPSGRRVWQQQFTGTNAND